MKRVKRDTRFSILRGFFNSYAKGYMDDNAIESNIKEQDLFLYEKEIEKFAQAYPDVNMEEFEGWLKKFNAIKVAGQRKSGDGAGRQSLNTKEKAEEYGVAPENVETYIGLINQIFAVSGEVDKLVSEGRKLNHYFGKVKPKKSEEGDSAQSD